MVSACPLWLLKLNTSNIKIQKFQEHFHLHTVIHLIFTWFYLETFCECPLPYLRIKVKFFVSWGNKIPQVMCQSCEARSTSQRLTCSLWNFISHWKWKNILPNIYTLQYFAIKLPVKTLSLQIKCHVTRVCFIENCKVFFYNASLQTKN